MIYDIDNGWIYQMFPQGNEVLDGIHQQCPLNERDRLTIPSSNDGGFTPLLIQVFDDASCPIACSWKFSVRHERNIFI